MNLLSDFQSGSSETSNLQAKADEETYEAWCFFLLTFVSRGQSRLRFERLYKWIVKGLLLWLNMWVSTIWTFDMFQPPFVDQHVSPKKSWEMIQFALHVVFLSLKSEWVETAN